MRYDAVLLLSFGGPEGPADVLPFLRNVTAGRNVPDERLAEVAEQYELFGGVSPINDQNRALLAAIRADFADHDLDLPVYWGNRNWAPFIGDTVAEMAADGVERALVFVTSAFGSYSGCRQYREDLARAEAAVDDAPTLEKLRLYWNHPGFLEPVADRVAEQLRTGTARRVVFTAHSIPLSMAAACDYEAQLRAAAELVIDLIGQRDDADELDEITGWDLVWQSRSGPPQIPWLEPDVNDHLEALAAAGTDAATVCPLGFVSDHMEVEFDLDTQAAGTARRLGLDYRRAATVGTDPRFVAMVRDLVAERLDEGPRLWLGDAGPWPDQCPDGHCAPPQRPTGRPSVKD
ncbi:MAG: ferrochelatase [Acidimicrobiales bacterium]